MKSKLVPIVDIDSVVYRCGYASDSNKDAEGNVIQEPLSYCLNSVKGSVAAIMDVFEPSERSRIFLQGGGNYRDRVATIQPYKGNRDTSKRPTWYAEIREYLQEYWGAELVTGMETDDACGIEQWKNKDRSTCIVSIDKDLLMIPGHHYNFVRQEFRYVTLAEANKKFWTQVLTGDTTDNIRGIPKVGIKTAEKLLANVSSWMDMYAVARKAYADKGIADEFHENATLLWIQREQGVNYNGESIDAYVRSTEHIAGGDSREESQATDGQVQTEASGS